jgi:GT2 family glycosyltransferase
VFGGGSDLLAGTVALPSLVVAVLIWNGRGHLGDCLGSLLDSKYEPLTVVLVDNASSDDSVAFVRANFPGVEILANEENLRWAGGNNRIIRRLLGEGLTGRYLLLLNNDTIVPEGSLERLVRALLAEPRAWAATPRICYADDPSRAWYDGGLLGRYSGWVRHHGIRRLTGRLDPKPRFVDYGTGCALLVSERALHEVGELDESYHFYGEDVDYSLRIRAAGGEILHVPRALVLHKVSASIGRQSAHRAYWRSRSHIKLLQRHWPRSYLPLLAGSQFVYYSGLTVWHLWGGRWRTALAAWQGVIDELQGQAGYGKTGAEATHGERLDVWTDARLR